MDKSSGKFPDKPAHESNSRYDPSSRNELWINGLLCAYELIHSPKRQLKARGKIIGQTSQPVMGKVAKNTTEVASDASAAIRQSHGEHPDPAETANYVDLKIENPESNKNSLGKDRGVAHSTPAKEPRFKQWVPIGWVRIAELVDYVQRQCMLSEDTSDGSGTDDGSGAVAGQAAPFRQLQKGPIWWCHVLAGHPHVIQWLTGAQWLHPAIASGLRDESRLISDRMKHLLYEVPVRVGGGLLFELLGHSVGDPKSNELEVPIVLRSWTSLNFLLTAVHVKGKLTRGLNVIGISEVQDMVAAGGASAPQSAHEVVASLADRLARWDDRLFRKHFFGVADEVELKFVSRREEQDLAVLSIILNDEIKQLSTQVIRVKWALHVRREISYELLAHLHGENTRATLERIAASTEMMLEEQEAVCDRLFRLQDAMQSTYHASLQDTSVRIMHNLAVIGSAGLVLTLLVGLFGTNLGGIPGQTHAPHAFTLFAVGLSVLGALLIALGLKFLQFRRGPTEEQLASRKRELHNLVMKFQKSAEAHEKLRADLSSKLL